MPRRSNSFPQPHRHVPDNRTCQSKRAYATKLLAEQAAELSMLGDFHLELDVYKCPFGNHWHLTRRSLT